VKYRCVQTIVLKMFKIHLFKVLNAQRALPTMLSHSIAEAFTPLCRGLTSSCRAYEIFKHHCLCCVGIRSCETTQANPYIRTEPVSFKYRPLCLYFVAKDCHLKCRSGTLFLLYTPLRWYGPRSFTDAHCSMGIASRLRAFRCALTMTYFGRHQSYKTDFLKHGHTLVKRLQKLEKTTSFFHSHLFLKLVFPKERQ
jgi:hypothetical protein